MSLWDKIWFASVSKTLTEPMVYSVSSNYGTAGLPWRSGDISWTRRSRSSGIGCVVFCSHGTDRYSWLNLSVCVCFVCVHTPHMHMYMHACLHFRIQMKVWGFIWTFAMHASLTAFLHPFRVENFLSFLPLFIHHIFASYISVDLKFHISD